VAKLTATTITSSLRVAKVSSAERLAVAERRNQQQSQTPSPASLRQRSPAPHLLTRISQPRRDDFCVSALRKTPSSLSKDLNLQATEGYYDHRKKVLRRKDYQAAEGK
jgi:hypothetical protein